MVSSDIDDCSTQNSQRSTASSVKSEKADSKRSVNGIIICNGTRSLLTEDEIPTSAAVVPSPVATAETQSTRSALRSLNELYASQTAKEVTVEDLPSKKKKVKKSRKKSSRSIRLRNKPTPLTFHMLSDMPHIAVCQLVLCNISERSLSFKIKCIPGGNIVAAPVGNAHIAPHSQFRLRLTWTKVDDLANWDELEAPKLLLITNFMDENDEEKEDVTQTRLVAKISLSKKCNAITAPVEQLLLDAIGKSTEVSSFHKPLTKSATPSVAGDNNSLVRQFADFVNGLTDRSLIIIAISFIALLVFFK